MRDDLARRYRKRVLEPYGIGAPALYALLALAVLVAIAPGVATWHAQNGYARLGIAILAAVGVLGLLAAGYDLRRVDLTRYKLTADRDGPNAPSDNYLDAEFEPVARATDGGREARHE